MEKLHTKKPLVSVIVPTFSREKFHERLYFCFTSQTYDQKELCILDDSAKPSAFFETLKDVRVRYIHIKKRMTIGEKRNFLLEMAQGEIIAHFDDDDLYKSSYLDFMVEALGDNAFVKLSKWFSYHEPTKSYFYWDTSKHDTPHAIIDSKSLTRGTQLQKEVSQAFLQANYWGYGFSYVYRKSLYPVVSFDPKDHFGEDLQFVLKALKSGATCKAVADENGLAIHCLHGSNLSKIFPQYELPLFLIKKIFC